MCIYIHAEESEQLHGGISWVGIRVRLTIAVSLHVSNEELNHNKMEKKFSK